LHSYLFEEKYLIRGRRILIVEDDPIALKVLSDIVSNFGYMVEDASTGYEAIETARKKDFEGVLLDLGLPDMIGIEVLGRLRHLHPTIPILIVSGRKEYERSVLGKGANGFLLKPFEASTLRDLMSQWFGEP
jgi:DNA-binding response OmpR family regulator